MCLFGEGWCVLLGCSGISGCCGGGRRGCSGLVRLVGGLPTRLGGVGGWSLVGEDRLLGVAIFPCLAVQ